MRKAEFTSIIIIRVLVFHKKHICAIPELSIGQAITLTLCACVMYIKVKIILIMIQCKTSTINETFQNCLILYDSWVLFEMSES